MSHGAQGGGARRELDAETARDVAETMQALSTPSRLLILGRLREEPRSVGKLAEAIGMEQSAVSHQLRLLRLLGLVTGERRGRHTIYTLHDTHIGTLLDEAIGHVEHLRLARAMVEPTAAYEA